MDLVTVNTDMCQTVIVDEMCQIPQIVCLPQALNSEVSEWDCTPSLAPNHSEKCNFLHTLKKIGNTGNL